MNLSLRSLLIITISAALWTACASKPTTPTQTDVSQQQKVADKPAATPRFGNFGFDTAGMNREVTPGDDFYSFASGTWQTETKIPADRARFGMFDLLSLEAEAHVNKIILDAEKAAALPDNQPGSNAQLIGDLYKSWMNEQAIEQAGLTPAEPGLQKIAALTTHAEAAR